MKRFVGAMALGCVFSVSALSGELPTGGSPSPTPTGTSQTTANSPGDLPTGGVASLGTNEETQTGATTVVILTILSLLSF